MMWKLTRHPLERAAVAGSGLALGGAVGFAILSLAGSIAAAVSGGVAAVAVAILLLERVDVVEAVPFELPDEDELLLDDPIADSRVVQLFEREQPVALPEPGELVARISDYLGSGRAAAPAQDQPVASPADASAALHAALADIRQSLRR